MQPLARSPFLALLISTLGALACAQGTSGPEQGTGAEAPAVAAPPSSVRDVPAPEFDQEHTLWTEVLRQHVHGDEFDYAGLKKDPAKLDAYLAALHAVQPEQLAVWTREQRFAFWVNAYNAHTIEKVVENYPLDSIKDLNRALGLKSVFDDEFIPMKSLHPHGEDDELSLNDIENEILRPRFEDARVHAAINCASKSCPPLRDEAFVASRLDRQLDEQMRSFVNDPRRNRFDAEKKTLFLSEIFKWFAEDFEHDAGSVREFLLRYVPEQDAALVREGKIRYIDYDWALNDYHAPDAGR